MISGFNYCHHSIILVTIDLICPLLDSVMIEFCKNKSAWRGGFNRYCKRKTTVMSCSNAYCETMIALKSCYLNSGSLRPHKITSFVCFHKIKILSYSQRIRRRKTRDDKSTVGKL